MVKASPIKTSWNAGEWSPLMDGHINLERWSDSSRLLQNLIPLKQGPIVRRGGSRFVKEVKTSANNTALIPFEFNVEQEYQIEMGDQYLRFYTSNAAIVETTKVISGATAADPVVVTATAHGYSNGDEVYIAAVAGMTELNGKFYLVSAKTTNTFALQDVDGVDIDGSAYTAYTSAGTAAKTYEIASPFTSANLFDSDGLLQLQHAQSADVLYITHGTYETRAITRTSNTNWGVNTIQFNDGPYLPINDSSTTLSISGTSGSVTVTASGVTGINTGDGFVSTDIGRLIRWNDGSDWTWLEITAVADTTHCTATIKGENAGGTSATEEWRLGLFSETTGYPRVITFFQDRLFLGGCSSYPDRWALSRTGGYSDTDFYFAPSDTDGTVTDDASLSGTLASGKVNTIQWAGTDDKGLIVGTAAREWIIRASSSGEVLTQANAKADAFSAIGSAYIQPVQAESGTIFAQRARRKLHDIIYSFERDQLKPRDLTITSEHITKTGMAEVKFQQEPVNSVWIRRTDGLLIGYTYYPDEAVFGAHRHILGGTNVAVKSLSVIPSADGSRDELWFIVERTINGVTRKYIEYMERYYEDDMAKEDAFHIDSGLTYDGVATATVSGLGHLEGETVKLMVDGKSHPDLVVTGGVATLANSVTASVIQIGLGNTWAFKSQRMEAGAQDGTAQGKTKRITRFVVRLLNTLGLYYGSSETVYDSYDFDQGSSYDEDLALYSGDTKSLPWPSGYDSDGTIYLQHDGVFPATILMIAPQVVTQDRG